MVRARIVITGGIVQIPTHIQMGFEPLVQMVVLPGLIILRTIAASKSIVDKFTQYTIFFSFFFERKNHLVSKKLC